MKISASGYKKDDKHTRYNEFEWHNMIHGNCRAWSRQRLKEINKQETIFITCFMGGILLSLSFGLTVAIQFILDNLFSDPKLLPFWYFHPVLWYGGTWLAGVSLMSLAVWWVFPPAGSARAIARAARRG
jgi:hypothetical protein